MTDAVKIADIVEKMGGNGTSCQSMAVVLEVIDQASLAQQFREAGKILHDRHWGPGPFPTIEA